MENKIGEDFKSIQPDFTNFEIANSSTEVQFMTVVEVFLLQIGGLMPLVI